MRSSYLAGSGIFFSDRQLTCSRCLIKLVKCKNLFLWVFPFTNDYDLMRCDATKGGRFSSLGKFSFIFYDQFFNTQGLWP